MTLHTTDTNLDPDALNVFRKLFYEHETCFLLETLQDKYQPHTSGQSYIGVAPKHVYSASDTTFYVDKMPQPDSNPYEALRQRIVFDESLPAGFLGGLVGYFGHEAIQYIENSITFDYQRKFLDFAYGEYEDGLIFKSGKSPRYFYGNVNRLEIYAADNQAKKNDLTIRPKRILKDTESYARIIEQAHQEILNGRVFQVVLANRFEYEFEGDLLQLYKELRDINPSPFMFCLKFGNIVTIGASPELLVHTNSQHTMYLEALAGTIRRGLDDAEDAELAQQLLNDEKEIAEHSMLVDLARNDIGRICQIGSVTIEDLMYIKKLSHVQHISSMVSGTMREDRDAFDALASSFSAGTLSGAPKIEAVKMISSYESAERGPYGGTIGYFSYNGESVHAVNIRSVSAINNTLYLHSGSGVVYDSTAEREADEIRIKKAAMDRAMKPFIEEEN